ncbi:MAG: site-specific DNA-methyltransferase [Deltaproteobacteria bacterium]|nr:site-specific DNA-methyltransferase [Deltaproteobacteria bacterium]
MTSKGNATTGFLSSEQEAALQRLIQGDARNVPFIKDESVHLIITSPPYWTLKRYNENPNQLGHIADYEEFLGELAKVWKEMYRILVPGGRLVCVVGDVCLSRRNYGRHVVFPLHSDIAVKCRKIGFDNLNPIIWHKIANANYEVKNGSKFLGKPYEPNAIIKNDIEFILMQRKPGGYRQPTERQRKLSMISKEEYNKWFQQFWNISGASTREHPAPFPLELAYRLVRMFSFYGDTVVDPFCGTGTTMIAAMKAGRNSIGVEIDSEYCRMTEERLRKENIDIFLPTNLEFIYPVQENDLRATINEKRERYVTRIKKTFR